MKIVIPIKNLVSDEDFIFNDTHFISTFNTERYLNNLKIRDNYKLNKNTHLSELIGFDLSWYYGSMLALYEVPNFNEEDIISTHEQLIIFMKNITEKLNRTLDLIRIRQCNVTEQEKLPSYPGICIDGFSSILLINDKNEYIPFVCRLHKMSVVEGMGLYLDDVSRYVEDPLYDVLYNDIEENYVSTIIKQVVKRLNEAMYIPDPNSQFVYLMSTLEVICSPEYIGFSEVRQKIAAIVCSNKSSYLKMGDQLRELSEIYRTDVIHNGKDIFKEQFENMSRKLLFLQGLIVRCIYNLIASEANSEEDFHNFVELKKTQLDVQPNPKLNKDDLIEEILQKYCSDVIELDYNVWSRFLKNLNANFLKEIVDDKVIIKSK
jgi:hypothetical protein